MKKKKHRKKKPRKSGLPRQEPNNDHPATERESWGSPGPFHGNSLTIWHLDDHNNYVPQWKSAAPEKETEMLHATWADTILGKPTGGGGGGGQGSPTKSKEGGRGEDEWEVCETPPEERKTRVLWKEEGIVVGQGDERVLCIKRRFKT